MADFHFYVHLDGLPALAEAVAQGFAALVAVLSQEGIRMSEALDLLTAEVQATNGVMQSVIVLLQGIEQRLVEAGTDQAALDALRLDLNTNQQALAAAAAAMPPEPATP